MCELRAIRHQYGACHFIMLGLGKQPSAIRVLYAYGLKRKAEVGEENVYDYSIGNPSIPAPPAVRARIEQLLEEPPEQLHAYTMSPGLQSVRQTLLRQLSLKAVSPQVLNNLYDIWEKQEASFFNNRDYMRMAYHLAIMFPERWQDIIAMQHSRLTTEDERREFEFVSRACIPDADVQQQLFDDLLKVENRRVEPWARTMLALLNDPVREPLSNRYLVPGLDVLEEIQRTGDIFFPGYWLSSLLDGHHSSQAVEIVNTWLDNHPALAPALRNKVMENAYWLLDIKDH